MDIFYFKLFYLININLSDGKYGILLKLKFLKSRKLIRISLSDIYDPIIFKISSTLSVILGIEVKKKIEVNRNRKKEKGNYRYKISLKKQFHYKQFH